MNLTVCVLLALFFSCANGLFDKKKAQDAKSNPMVSMVLGAMGPECEKLYDKAMDKMDKVYHPVWDWLMDSCNKKCGTSAEMQSAVPYLSYALQLAEHLFDFFKKSTVKFDIWGLCPRLVTHKIYVGYINKIMSGCMAQKPHGYNVMHAKDLCHLASSESFNKTADCIKEFMIGDITPKIMPPPMDCIGNVKKYCATKHHETILGWMDFFMVTLHKARNTCKAMKDKSGENFAAEWNAYCVLEKFFNAKCKPDKAFCSKYKMPSP